MNKSINSLYRTGLMGLTSLALVGCGSNLEESVKKEISLDGERVAFGENHWTKRKTTKTQLEPYVEEITGMKMIPVQGGELEIIIGGRTYTEILEPFYIGETEVSIGQWFAVRERDTGYDPKEETHQGKGGVPRDIRNSDFPVTGISFLNAKRYVDYLTMRTGDDYRIPTSAQWMIACRGQEHPKEGLYGRLVKENANIRFEDAKDSEILPVRHLRPNSQGLYGMLGNVSEFMVIPIENPNRDILEKLRKHSLKFEEGFIAHSPNILFSSEFNSDFSESKYYPNYFSSDYIYADIEYDSKLGFRLVMIPSKED
jgi:formylglycine-generating enzyme required for sulfatase activity